MTRHRALLRLLQHGELTMEQILAIGGAGWDEDATAQVLVDLTQAGSVILSGRCFHLTTNVHDALRRLHDRQQPKPERAPAAVAPLQPGVPHLRGPLPVRRSQDDFVVSAAARRAHDPDRRGLGRAWARRAAAARRGGAVAAGLGGVGS